MPKFPCENDLPSAEARSELTQDLQKNRRHKKLAKAWSVHATDRRLAILMGVSDWRQDRER